MPCLVHSLSGIWQNKRWVLLNCMENLPGFYISTDGKSTKNLLISTAAANSIEYSFLLLRKDQQIPCFQVDIYNISFSF